MSFSHSTKLWLFVSIPRQVVQIRAQENVLQEFPVSTSVHGTGEQEGSLRTPTGWHHIAQKIGDGLPSGAILKGRTFIGVVWEPGVAVAEDPVLTRILWLAGDEEHNQNTFNRYIYFHGTHDEENIGQPLSHGCIRLRNSDMISLYNEAFENMLVYLAKNDEEPVWTPFLSAT